MPQRTQSHKGTTATQRPRRHYTGRMHTAHTAREPTRVLSARPRSPVPRLCSGVPGARSEGPLVRPTRGNGAGIMGPGLEAGANGQPLPPLTPPPRVSRPYLEGISLGGKRCTRLARCLQEDARRGMEPQGSAHANRTQQSKACSQNPLPAGAAKGRNRVEGRATTQTDHSLPTTFPV